MRSLHNAKKIVIKVGTSTLTFANGSLNLRRIDELTRVISDIKNSGKEVLLVTSGAISVGTQNLGLSERPNDIPGKQAMSSIGQCKLMNIYDEFFRKYNHTIGQALLTKDIVENAEMHKNTLNTFETLLKYKVIPIINANDTVSVEETSLDNDTLSAHVANIVKADLLILLTDVDGLYDKHPKEDGAKLLQEVHEITDDIKNNVHGAGSVHGIGGMITKVAAAEIASKSGTKTIIMNGNNPLLIYNLLEGEKIGTIFH